MPTKDEKTTLEISPSRRTFLKIAGAGIAAGIGAPVVVAFAGGKGLDKAGKQWAMVIDPKACLREQGCTKCIAVCHQTHNVPDISRPEFGYSQDPKEVAKREIKWIWKEPYDHVFHDQIGDDVHGTINTALSGKDVMVLCNHCKDPPCCKVCPTQATFKRESDGLVMMDMHRCIGCRYCIVGCPYGARSFNWKEPWPRVKDQQGRIAYDPKFGTPPNLKFPTRAKGVVEKCNFCAERLADSERTGGPFVPACVEACPSKAMVFGDINDEQSPVRKVLATRYSIRRKPHLGTGPQIYYVI